MDEKERYLVAMYDGHIVNVVARNFTDIILKYGEDNIWMMLKLDYDEEDE